MQTQLEPADDMEIRALFDRVLASWNARGTVSYDEIFTEDSDYVTFAGQHLAGRAANEELHAELGKGILRGAHLHGHVTDTRALTPDVAVMHAIGNLQLRFHRKPKPSRDSIQTYILTRTAVGWRVAAFQNTRITRPTWISRLFEKLFS